MARALLFLTMWVIQLALIAAFASHTWIRGQVEHEKAAVALYLGEEAARDLERRADAVFRLTMVNSGIVATANAALLPDPLGPRLGGQDVPVVFDFMGRTLSNFWYVVYQSIYRVLLLAEWVPVLGLVLVASVIDGAVSRKVNKAAMRYANPVRYRAGMRALVALLVIPLFYLTLPISVSPVVVPFWFFLLAGLTMAVIANAQHRI